MPPEDILAAVGLLAVIAYAVLGGADFGGGIWDLFAQGPRRYQQRAAIAHAMGPVWEANHVWLIFIIVLTFTAFPRAFAALCVALFVPFHLVLVGITLRGAAFVFRNYGKRDRAAARWGAIFGMASVITPVLLGMCLAAVSVGGLRWLAALSLMIGGLALVLCAYLAAVYLTNETVAELQEDFRQRALLADTFVVGLTVLLLPVIYFEAPHLWDGLISYRAAPVLVAGVVSALLSGWALLTRWYRLARLAAIVQVALLLVGWGLAQYPYVIFSEFTLAGAAAPRPTLLFVLYTIPFAAAVLLPSLWLLFAVFTGSQTEDGKGNINS
jgi:cytochrome d ubiquinol oxidase subunit II